MGNEQPIIKNSATFAEQVDAVLSGEYPRGESVLFRNDTPFSLCAVGLDDLPMLITPQHIKNINASEETSTRNEHHHGISVSQLSDIPSSIEKPAMLIESKGKDGSDNIVAVLNEFDEKGRPIIVIVSPNGKGMYNKVEIDSNFVKSLYGRNGFEGYLINALNEGRVLYWDKKRSFDLLDTVQVQYPQALTSLAPNTIIRKMNRDVNSREQKITENNSKDSGDELLRMRPEQIQENTEKEGKEMEIKQPKIKSSATFAEQVDAVLGGVDTTSTHLEVSKTTPPLLRMVGFPNLPILITSKHIKTITEDTGTRLANYHGLGADLVKKLPELIADPVMIMDSLSKDDSVVVVTQTFDKDNRPVIGAIKMDGRGNLNEIEISANIFLTAFGKKNFSDFLKRNIEKGTILYCSKKKSQELFKTPGLQLPDNFESLDFNTIIRKSKAFVNSREQKITENNSKDSGDELLRMRPEQIAENTEKKGNEMNSDETEFIGEERRIAEAREEAKRLAAGTDEVYVTVLESDSVELNPGDVMPLSEAEEKFTALNLKLYGMKAGAYKTILAVDYSEDGELHSFDPFEYDLGTEDKTLAWKIDGMRELEEQKTVAAARERAKQLSRETGEPFVTINWSESPALKRGEVLSLSEADKKLAELDAAGGSDWGYDKTELDIDFVYKGEPESYEKCRFDIGTENGGLIHHIDEFVKYDTSMDAGERSEVGTVLEYFKAHRRISLIEETAIEFGLSEEEQNTVQGYILQTRHGLNASQTPESFELPMLDLEQNEKAEEPEKTSDRAVPEQIKENTEKKETEMENNSQTTAQGAAGRVYQIRDEMVKTLTGYIDQNPGQWQRGWSNLAGTVPENGKTGATYRGINSLYLALTAMQNGYTDPRWVTFAQAKELGAAVKKGEKSVPIVFYELYDRATKKAYDSRTVKNMTEEEAKAYRDENVYAVLKYASVFNAAQCHNFPKRDLSSMQMSEEERAKQNVLIETIIANSAAPVLNDGGNRAYYSPREDKVHLPPLEAFDSMQDYYATALHEIAHSTGHESRLNRRLGGSRSSEEYAKEELRAELACVFMQLEHGIQLEGKHFNNHAAYLNGWLKEVKDDPKIFYEAVRDAEKISDYVSDHYTQAELTEENTRQVGKHEEKDILDQSIKDWYVERYPNDEFGYRLTGTFKDLQEAIKNGADVYGAVLGIDDSVARERIFTRLAELTNSSYESVYKAWFGESKEAKPESEASAAPENTARQEQENSVGGNTTSRPLVVNLYGGPGAGKTTAALELTAALKKEGYNVEYVSEFAKQLVLEGRTDELKDQEFVTDEQYKRLDRLRNSGVEILVTDSPVLLGKVYGEGTISAEYDRKISGYYDSFENFNLVVQRGDTFQTDGRVHNLEQSKELDAKITSMLRGNKIFYGNYRHDEIDKTVDRINTTYKRLYVEKSTGEHKEKSSEETVGEELARGTTWSRVNLPNGAVGDQFGKTTLVRMPLDGEYAHFGVFVPTQYLKRDEKSGKWQLNIGDKFSYRLSNDGRQVELTGQELKDSFAGMLIGKQPERVAPSRYYAKVLDRLEKNVPKELRTMPNWIVYRTWQREDKDKKGKVIKSAVTGEGASPKNSADWTDFDTAMKYARANNFEGLGFVLEQNSGITCIDLDECVTDVKTGGLKERAAKLVKDLDGTYMERSTSGNGIHIFIKDDILKHGKYKDSSKNKEKGDLEVFDNQRIVSMTGDMFSKTNALTRASSAATVYLRQELGEKPQVRNNVQSAAARGNYRPGSDSEVIARCRNSPKRGAEFEALFTGHGVTGDASADDMKLANILAFFTDCDAEQSMRIMRQASTFRPEKPESYYTHTISKAIGTLYNRPSYGGDRAASGARSNGVQTAIKGGASH